MDDLLLDTNVLSYTWKRGDSRADLYKRHIEGKRCAVSFVTVGELYAWAFEKRWTAQHIVEMEARLRGFVIVPYDVEICKAYAGLWNLKTPAGGKRNIGDNDRWIAACAIRHNLPLVTHNRKHFEGIPGLKIISEAEPAPSVATARAIVLPDLLGPPREH